MALDRSKPCAGFFKNKQNEQWLAMGIMKKSCPIGSLMADSLITLPFLIEQYVQSEQ